TKNLAKKFTHFVNFLWKSTDPLLTRMLPLRLIKICDRVFEDARGRDGEAGRAGGLKPLPATASAVCREYHATASENASLHPKNCLQAHLTSHLPHSWRTNIASSVIPAL